MRYPSIAVMVLSVTVAFGDDDSAQQESERQPRQQTQRSEARGNAAQRMRTWQAMDTDGDKKISREEATGLMRTNFDRVDADGDGLIDRSELQALARRLSGNRNRQQQQNGNRNEQTMTTEQLLARAPEGVKVVPDIAYREGHERWKLDLAMPTEPAEKPHPAIVFIHGGGWRSGDKRRAAFLDPALEYAADGYVTITVNYRYISEVPMMDIVADVKCAVRWLRAHAEEYGVDPDRIGATGNSAGAHLSAMLGLCPKSAGLEGDGPWQEYSSMVQAVCCSATPTSFLIPMNNRRQEDETGADNETDSGERNNDARRRRRQPPRNSAYTMTEELRRKVSPITYASADAPPFLLVHEVSDGTVSIKQAEVFVQALRDAGAADVTFMKYEDGSGHGAFGANIKETGPARKAFFDRVLRPHQAL